MVARTVVASKIVHAVVIALFVFVICTVRATTTLGFKLADGVLLAVDSKASVGSYVGSRTVRKVLPISSHVVGTMAGGAAGVCTIGRYHVLISLSFLRRQTTRTVPENRLRVLDPAIGAAGGNPGV